MSQAKYRSFAAFLIIWAALVLIDWVHIQAYMNAKAGFTLGALWDMVKDPYHYTPANAVDPSKDWHHLWQITHPYYFGVFNSFVAIVPLIFWSRWTWQRYGGFKSHVGRAIMLMSIGTVTWGFGNVIWFYLNGCTTGWGPLKCSEGTTAPYPSWPDIGYLSILPLAAVALFFLMRALTVPLRAWGIVAGTLVAASALTWWLLYWLPGKTYVMGHSTWKETVASTIYTSSDIILLSMCVTLIIYSRRAAGGTFFPPVLAYGVAFLALYLADMGFFPRVAFDTFYNADFTDLLYGVCMWTITLGTFLFARAEQKTLRQMREFEAQMSADAGGE